MVKGTQKRIIVVKSPDKKIFEEAIFVVREDYLRKVGQDPERILHQATQAANAYLKTCGAAKERLLARLPAGIYAALGAVAAGIAWLAMRFVGV